MKIYTIHRGELIHFIDVLCLKEETISVVGKNYPLGQARVIDKHFGIVRLVSAMAQWSG